MERLISDYTFGTFVVDDGNVLAFEKAVEMSAASAKGIGAIVSGATGVGKTHLSHAIGHERTKRADSDVMWITSDRFMDAYLQAKKTNSLESFRTKVEKADTFLLESVHFLDGAVEAQNELTQILRALRRNGAVFWIDQCGELAHVTQSLQDESATYDQVSIAPLGLAGRLELLRRYAKRGGVRCHDDTLIRLAQRCHRNARELIGVFIRIQAFSQLEARAFEELAVEWLDQD